MAIKSVSIASIFAQDGSAQAKVIVRTDKTEFVSNFLFSLEENKDAADALMALDDVLRKKIHEALGYVIEPDKIAS